MTWKLLTQGYRYQKFLKTYGNVIQAILGAQLKQMLFLQIFGLVTLSSNKKTITMTIYVKYMVAFTLFRHLLINAEAM